MPTRVPSREKIFAVFTALILCVSFVPTARADDTTPAPDKSQYTLFNPVPDDQLRAFNTDRPTKSYAATTVDAGHFQYEADIASWTYDHYNATHTTTSSLVLVDPSLKLGLTQNTDLELAFSPLDINQSNNPRSDAIGFGDVYTRLKYNFFGNEGGTYALAIVPYVKIPTATQGIGNNHWEGGAYAPLTIQLPQDWSATLTTQLDILENAADSGTHPNFQNMLTIGHPLFSDKVTGYVEFWSDVNNDTGAQTQYTGDLAIAWLVTDNWQLDAGVNIGLNKAAPDLQSYLGISQRF